jgi:hypothetical protein
VENSSLSLYCNALSDQKTDNEDYVTYIGVELLQRDAARAAQQLVRIAFHSEPVCSWSTKCLVGRETSVIDHLASLEIGIAPLLKICATLCPWVGILTAHGNGGDAERSY